MRNKNPNHNKPSSMIKNEYKYVTALITCTLLLELMDELQRTPYYKHLLKMKGTMFLKELEKVVDDDLPIICGKSDNEMLSLMRDQQEMMNIIANMNPNHYPILNAMLKLYQKQPEAVRAALNIEVITDEQQIKQQQEQHERVNTERRDQENEFAGGGGLSAVAE